MSASNSIVSDKLSEKEKKSVILHSMNDSTLLPLVQNKSETMDFDCSSADIPGLDGALNKTVRYSLSFSGVHWGVNSSDKLR